MLLDSMTPFPLSQLDPASSPAINMRTPILIGRVLIPIKHYRRSTCLSSVDYHRWWPHHNNIFNKELHLEYA